MNVHTVRVYRDTGKMSSLILPGKEGEVSRQLKSSGTVKRVA